MRARTDGEEQAKTSRGISRRKLLIGGGAGAGLLVAWALWPRDYRPNLVAAPGETIFNAFLRIGNDGRVIVAVPQAEMGQGVYTALPQIVADELGADWRTVAVEPAPINPLYYNSVLLDEQYQAQLPAWLDGLGHVAAREIAMRDTLTMTAGSSSIRAFEGRLREAGAAARALLCMAAAKRWGIDWRACDTEAGFVVRGEDRLHFGELAAEAANHEPPMPLSLRTPAERTLVGKSVPRLDLPAKVDGSATFGADVRLPGMVYASIAHGPYGGAHPEKETLGDADAVFGVMAVVTNPNWVAVVATNWWAADRALQALATDFRIDGAQPDDTSIANALKHALDGGQGTLLLGKGDADAALRGPSVIRATYSVPLLAHATMETLTATARFASDRIEIWVPTQSAPMVRAAVARELGYAEHSVTIYPTFVGGGFGRNMEVDAAVEAAIIAHKVGKPVQLVWPRREDIQHSRFRPPALARLAGKPGSGGSIAAWKAEIATPSSFAEMMARIDGRPKPSYGAEAMAVEGALPPYAIAAASISQSEAPIGVPTGMWRSMAHSYTAFFTESFVDELALAAGIDPLSFRVQSLGQQPRLAKCLTMAAAIGGWQGGEPGVGQGLAAHSCFGSHVAMLVEAQLQGDRIKVSNVTAVVDCGRVIHPDIVHQQIEGGIVWGLANALGDAISIKAGEVSAKNFDALGLPGLGDMPDIRVEIVASELDPGGAGEIAVPPVAPAIANAVYAASGRRIRSLPLRPANA